MINEFSRRRFLAQAGAGVSAAWVATHWPQMVAAATHAHQAVQTGVTYKFEFFKPEEVAEVEAISARIIPTDETPGAREAGVIYFIDRALVTFASGDQQKYREGLPEIQKATQGKFPGVAKFSAATAEQQDAVLRAIEGQSKGITQRGRRNQAAAQTFFDVVRIHTISGFLIDPETSNGNRGGVGWKLIGREPEHGFQPPFGYYDKDYPGWQPAPKSVDK
jgi:gluconate 2-dehydrogenase gamma chain